MRTQAEAPQHKEVNSGSARGGRRPPGGGARDTRSGIGGPGTPGTPGAVDGTSEVESLHRRHTPIIRLQDLSLVIYLALMKMSHKFLISSAQYPCLTILPSTRPVSPSASHDSNLIT